MRPDYTYYPDAVERRIQMLRQNIGYECKKGSYKPYICSYCKKNRSRFNQCTKCMKSELFTLLKKRRSGQPDPY